MSAAATAPHDPPHVPVLIDAIISAVAPVNGVWLDGTFGNGGYSRALIEAGAERVIGVDRDPRAHALAADWIDEYEGRITLISDTFSNLDAHGSDLDGVVFDLGVSSMQIDEAERGFSFQKDGPLDMRMSQDGISAADIVNRADEGAIADILFRFGEERASRRIAKAIVAARPVETTLQLAEIVSGCLPRPKPGQSHPATRSFQALRIAVNDEYGELIAGLEAAERALKPGGTLAVVTFHSIEDRMVKRFFQERGGAKGQGSRHAPVTDAVAPGFVLKSRKAVVASGDEVAANPRARSAKLRIGIRTDAPAAPVARSDLGMPVISKPYGGIH